MMIHTNADGDVWHYVCLIASRRQNGGYPAACATYWAEMDADLPCDWCEEPVSGPGIPVACSCAALFLGSAFHGEGCALRPSNPAIYR